MSLVGRVLRGLALLRFYTIELVRSNVLVARHVLSPHLEARPAVVAVHLEPMSDVGLLLLAGMVTMTPGTLALDVADEGQTLYVHAMDTDDPEEIRRLVRDEYQDRLLEVIG